MEFMWTGISNVDLRVGGLFFGGIYKDYVTLNGGAGPYLAQGALSGIAPFIFEWIILTGLLYIIIKGLRGTVTWKPLMVAVGFALVTLVVQTIIVLVVYSTLPTLYLPVEVLANVSGGLDLMPAATVDAINSAQFITGVVQIAIYIWIVGLGALITRSITTVQTQTPPVIEGPPAAQQFGWLKSILVSAAALLLTILILGFLLG
jgi:hypothetical protein